MKLLFDENLSPRLVDDLSLPFPESQHAHDLGLGGRSDGELWNFAKAHGFAIVSKDSDFIERSVLDTHPPKVIWVRLGNCSTRDVSKLLHSHQEQISTFLQDPSATSLLLGR